MVVVTIRDMVGIGFVIILIVSFIIGFIIGRIKAWYDVKFKKNCFDCKYYYLQDVAGAGDCCWYNCKLHSEYHKDRHSMNDRYIYRKCEDFEKEVEKNDE